MKKAIWKFPLDGPGDLFELKMPEGATMLTVQVQDGFPWLYAMVDVDAQQSIRQIRMYGSEHHNDTIPGKYIGTVQLNGGALVLHVFDESRLSK